MLVMLCTRCQQREAKVWPDEKRAKWEAEFGTPWPMPDGLCKDCWGEWFKTPEAQEQMNAFSKAVNRKFREEFRKDMERWKENARAAALKALDVADAIAGKL